MGNLFMFHMAAISSVIRGCGYAVEREALYMEQSCID